MEINSKPENNVVSNPEENPFIETGNTETSSNSASEIPGLNETEERDPNSITVNIADTKVPIIVLFGPGKCGKTMTQVRLARYLHDKHYRVEPIRDFRPSDDLNYQEMCDRYQEFVNDEDAANSTNLLSFMLLEVLDSNGNRICQILEAPGEHYHSISNPTAQFPAYINNLINSATRKIWVITLEPNWNKHANCQSYSIPMYIEKIRILSSKINRTDDVVFLYNKIDATSLVQKKGEVNRAQMIKDIRNHFNGAIELFKNENPITSLWRPYNCEVVPFSTGTYNEYKEGTKTKVKYTVGPDEYPRNLWNVLQRLIRG